MLRPPDIASSNEKALSMIQLFGFPMSNYYSIVKMCLLEKGIPFEEHHQDFVVADDVSRAGQALLKTRRPEYFEKSPLGKIPSIGTPDGYLSETQIILEYLEELYPQVPLLPEGAFARAKARELARVLDLHLELVVRRVYPEAFFGGLVAPETRAEVRDLALLAIDGVAALSALSPYAMGPTFTYVDCVAAVHLTVVRPALAKLYDIDVSRTLPNLRPYLARIAERPSWTASMGVIHGALTALGMAH
jgi:glutathione S-transferase